MNNKTLIEKLEFIIEGKKKPSLSVKGKKVKGGETAAMWPLWGMPPSSEALDKIKQLIAARKEKQVESKQVTPPTPEELKAMHDEYEFKSRASGRTPGKPHPDHGKHFPEDPPNENLTPAQQKRRNKTK
tara:strand:+ start:1172 stop:1558 length:387 start_codon:yes stop_codon:yes gene_type:complete